LGHKKGRDRAFHARPSCTETSLGLGLHRPRVGLYPEADAAWLTCWSHPVVFVGLTSIVEPTSSNSKSSALEPYWRTSIRFWALPVFAAPYMLTHWLEVIVSIEDVERLVDVPALGILLALLGER
jgi:hypothetical protein